MDKLQILPFPCFISKQSRYCLAELGFNC